MVPEKDKWKFIGIMILAATIAIVAQLLGVPLGSPPPGA